MDKSPMNGDAMVHWILMMINPLAIERGWKIPIYPSIHLCICLSIYLIPSYPIPSYPILSYRSYPIHLCIDLSIWRFLALKTIELNLGLSSKPCVITGGYICMKIFMVIWLMCVHKHVMYFRCLSDIFLGVAICQKNNMHIQYNSVICQHLSMT